MARATTTDTAKRATKTAAKAKAPKARKTVKVEALEETEVDTAVAEEAAEAPRKAGKKRPAGDGPTLVIVESPAKAKTIKKYLGRSFDVRASVGHVKDLPKSKMGVDIESGSFQPEYDVIKGKAKVVSEIKRAARTASRVLLATDPDREGEAIAWHISEELGAEGGDERVRRVLFHEITKPAIQKAIEHPIELDRKKFDSQQARRILDRIVGYQISPLLWDNVRRGLSAGRVQSVAVRLVVEREREIEAFKPEEYWSLDADLAARLPPEFRAKLARLEGKKAELKEGETTKALAAELEQARFVVETVDKKERRRNPPPPFTTAKLQQEAANRLGFTAKKTMTLAQRLYEGVELGDETVGLITYMRTDSVRLSTEAVDAARAFIGERYGKDHLPEAPNVFKTKAKAAQEAHEAVRPTNLEWTPERTLQYFEAMGERDMYRLYELVWNRFLACQMVPAVYDQTTADIAAERDGSAGARVGAEGEGKKPARATFRATGSILKFPGYLAVYGAKPPEEEAGAEEEKKDEAEAGEPAKNAERQLPPLEAGQELRLVKLNPEQHFTQPPPRYNESSLVKELEQRGIGRPSTYAAILETIQEKTYVEKIEKNFKPTHLGILVTDELVRAFPREMDVAFTAGMEEKLDEIEEGNAAWQAVLRDFYDAFKVDLASAKKNMRNVKKQEIETDLVCEKCGERKMVIKWGRNGEFLACPGYPDCRNTMNFKRDEDGSIVPMKEEDVPVEDKCPTCGAAMVMKRGRFGRFLACTRYPECKGTKPVSIGVTCPKGCGGYVSEKRSKRGRTFYGCSSYPKCDFVSWDKPRNEACPSCGSAYLLDKCSKRTGPFIACPNKECGYRREAPQTSQPPSA